MASKNFFVFYTCGNLLTIPVENFLQVKELNDEKEVLYEGEKVSIVNLSTFFLCKKKPKMAVIMDCDGKRMAIAAEKILDSIQVDERNIKTVKGISKSPTPIISDVILLNDERIIKILNLNSLSKLAKV